MSFSLARRVFAEFLGTAFFLSAVVGSGIMGERPSGGNAAVAVLASSIAPGAVLVALIFTSGYSGWMIPSRINAESGACR